MFFLGLGAWLLFVYGLATSLCCPYADTDEDTDSSEEEQDQDQQEEQEEEPEIAKEVESPPVSTRLLRVRTQSQRRRGGRVHYTSVLSDCEEE